jgi:hypothetical protein
MAGGRKFPPVGNLIDDADPAQIEGQRVEHDRQPHAGYEEAGLARETTFRGHAWGWDSFSGSRASSLLEGEWCQDLV